MYLNLVERSTVPTSHIVRLLLIYLEYAEFISRMGQVVNNTHLQKNCPRPWLPSPLHHGWSGNLALERPTFFRNWPVLRSCIHRDFGQKRTSGVECAACMVDCSLFTVLGTRTKFDCADCSLPQYVFRLPEMAQHTMLEVRTSSAAPHGSPLPNHLCPPSN